MHNMKILLFAISAVYLDTLLVVFVPNIEVTKLNSLVYVSLP